MAWSVWRTTQINTGLSFNTRLGALLVHVVRVCSTLPGLGEGEQFSKKPVLARVAVARSSQAVCGDCLLSFFVVAGRPKG